MLSLHRKAIYHIGHHLPYWFLTSCRVPVCVHLSANDPYKSESTGNALWKTHTHTHTEDFTIQIHSAPNLLHATPPFGGVLVLQQHDSAKIKTKKNTILTGQCKPLTAKQKRKAGYISRLMRGDNSTLTLTSCSIQSVTQVLLTKLHFFSSRVLVCALDAVENVPSFWIIAVHLRILQDKRYGFIQVRSLQGDHSE